MKHENIYLIKLSDDKEVFYKIGTSVHRFCRFYEIMKSGYQVTIIYMVFGIDPFEAFEAEHALQKLFKSYIPLKKFGGYNECFKHINIDQYKSELFNLITSYSEISENIFISWR